MKKPRPRVLRDIAVSIVTPFAFSLRTGHLRSSLSGLACDARGQPLPWLTYPAIDFLQRLDLSEARVLEYGAGQSTRWFAARAKTVTSVEEDRAWAEAVRAAVPPNVLIADAPHHPVGTFDIVLIDNLDRLPAAKAAIERVTHDGFVMLDNSEGFWGAPGTYPIIDLFHAAGFMRVDFYGFSPGRFVEHCTSIFFKPECRWLRSGAPPRMRDHASPAAVA